MSQTSSASVRLGTRGSPLARWQAEWVAAQLTRLGVETILVPITTSGDRHTEGTIGSLGDRGVFTREIQLALLERRIDLAVHSLKDLPTDHVPGLCLAAVPERGPVGDVFVSRDHPSLAQLPPQAVVGTGSLRRRAQLLHQRRDFVLQDVRGNVDTRLRKLDEGRYDALILAEAGLVRLGLAAHVTERLRPEIMMPAVGQGALGLETRCDDSVTRTLIERLDHRDTHAAVLAERSMLAALCGGCLAPIAALGAVRDGTLTLIGRVLHPEGTTRLDAEASSSPEYATSLGQQVAESLIAQGASDLIGAARQP